MDTEDPSSASCRIVVVSSSLDTSRDVATRIKALSGDDSETLAASEVIHWTIKNKYYTASVHFHPIHLEGLESIELDDVPAIIYAWKENEPYKDHLKQVSEHTSAYEPEVSLAISMAPSADEGLEDFLFEHGFEYIDGHSQVTDRSASLSGSTDAPGFHRALDALSTIMWPSMVQAEAARTKVTKVAGQRAPSTYADGLDEVDLDLQAIMNAASTSGGKSAIQHEMEMLERWLENDGGDDHGYSSINDTSGAYADVNADVDNDDYASLYSHSRSFVTVKSDDPWSTEPQPGYRAEKDTTGTPGFDDDFAEFVSAPPAAGDKPAHAASTGATGYADLESDSDPELPSEAEIHAASARIFGSSLSSPFPAPAPAQPDTSTAHRDSAPALAPAQDKGTGDAVDADADTDAPAFDLTRVLGALEGMKAEIAQIPDTRARRAAARQGGAGSRLRARRYRWRAGFRLRARIRRVRVLRATGRRRRRQLKLKLDFFFFN